MRLLFPLLLLSLPLLLLLGFSDAAVMEITDTTVSTEKPGPPGQCDNDEETRIENCTNVAPYCLLTIKIIENKVYIPNTKHERRPEGCVESPVVDRCIQERKKNKYSCFCDSRKDTLCSSRLEMQMKLQAEAVALYQKAHPTTLPPTTTPDPTHRCLEGADPLVACTGSSFCHSKIFYDRGTFRISNRSGLGCVEKLPDETHKDSCRKVESFNASDPIFECFCPSEVGRSCNALDEEKNKERRGNWDKEVGALMNKVVDEEKEKEKDEVKKNLDDDKDNTGFPFAIVGGGSALGLCCCVLLLFALGYAAIKYRIWKRKKIEEEYAKEKAIQEAKEKAEEKAIQEAKEKAEEKAIQEAKEKAIQEAKEKAIQEAKEKAIQEAKEKAIRTKTLEGVWHEWDPVNVLASWNYYITLLSNVHHTQLIPVKGVKKVLGEMLVTIHIDSDHNYLPMVASTAVDMKLPGQEQLPWNFVDNGQRFIAAQCPNKSYLGEFFLGLVHADVKCIMQLTQRAEAMGSGTTDYLPPGKGSLEQMKVGNTTIDVSISAVEDKKSYSRRKLQIEVKSEEASKSGTFVVDHFHYRDWSEKDIPSMRDDIFEVAYVVFQSFTKVDKRLLVHCRDGLGRTGAFLLVQILLKKAFQKITLAWKLVLEEAKYVRFNRYNAIQKPSQLAFALYVAAGVIIKAVDATTEDVLHFKAFSDVLMGAVANEQPVVSATAVKNEQLVASATAVKNEKGKGGGGGGGGGNDGGKNSLKGSVIKVEMD